MLDFLNNKTVIDETEEVKNADANATYNIDRITYDGNTYMLKDSAHTHAYSGTTGNESSHTHSFSKTVTSAAGSSHSHGIGTIAASTVDDHSHSIPALSGSASATADANKISVLTTVKTQGVLPSLAYTSRSITPVGTEGTAPSLTHSTVTVPNFTFTETSSGSGMYQLNLFKTETASKITAWNAGSVTTAGTAVACDDITGWSAGTLFAFNSGTAASGGHTHNVSTTASTSGVAGGHTHTMSGSTAGEAAHTHSVTVSGTTGAGGAHNHSYSGTTGNPQ